MAQQGGTCRATPGNGGKGATRGTGPAPPTTSSRDEKDEPGDGDWEVITKPEKEPASVGKGFSSSFDLQIGWGSWRTSLLSWDVGVRREHTRLCGCPGREERTGKTTGE
ncbi:hypothetical protein LX32DRAFT_255297 [Colletotrichum zoysiae]|uniref:Uncharacterized protein n=1 Tax=Colletotrichum zoysiae TaxID=1216348 RepID=A0AAD9MAD1_9PEZI|nr:hypothetical protein LX32DRAFT_255297 [Colletotrichum zoysiae]